MFLMSYFYCCAVAKFCLTLLRHHALQHARLPCPSLSPGVFSMSIESVIISNHVILCCPLLLPSIFPSIKVFLNELAFCIRWPNYWSFSFSISPCTEYSGLIPFRINWLLSLQLKRLSIVFSSTTI